MLARKRKPARLPGDGSAGRRESRTPSIRRRQRLALLCIVALLALAMTNSPYAVTVLEPEPPPVLASPLMEPRMERPPPKPNPPDAVLLPPRIERDEIAAAPPSERQSCLSFRRGLCPRAAVARRCRLATAPDRARGHDAIRSSRRSRRGCDATTSPPIVGCTGCSGATSAGDFVPPEPGSRAHARRM